MISHERMTTETSPESRYIPKRTVYWERFNNEIKEVDAEKIAKILRLKIGGYKNRFGGNYRTKGLYAYNTGQYKGEAYFGRGEGSRTSKEYRQYRPLLTLSESQKKRIIEAMPLLPQLY